MIYKARETIAKYNMFSFSDSVVAGISGGADSVSLLHFLAGLREEYGLSITAAHLNHGLRGAESERDERFVRDFCEDAGLELMVERRDVAELAARRGLSAEEAGREARYGFFSRLAAEKGAKIATAHTLNDSVETAILNLSRGTALRGLCGIPPVRGNIVRPLIACERREIEEYCRENGLSYVTDSSNASDAFARNRVRKYVLPVLTGVNEGFFGTAAATLEALRADADYLDNVAARTLSGIDLGGGVYSRDGYMSEDRAIRFRMLLRLLSQNGAAVDRQRLSRLDGIIVDGRGAEQLSGEIYLKAHGKTFRVDAPCEPREYFCVPVDIPKPGETTELVVFSDKKLRLMNADYEYYEENIKYNEKLLKNTLDYDRINGILIFRQKIPKDAIRLNGRGCTKTLKKLFQEAGIPPGERGGIPVLADAGGPLWIGDFGVDERAAVTKDTRRVLILNALEGGVGDEK